MVSSSRSRTDRYVRVHREPTPWRKEAPPVDWKLTRDPEFRRTLGIPSSEVDDVLQEAYVKLESREEVAPALLRRTAQRCFLDSKKSASRRRRREQHVARSRPERRTSERPDFIIERTEEASLTVSRVEAARSAARLSPDHEAMLDAWMNDRLKEFAAKRGIKESTARSRAHRARAKIAGHLRSDCFA